MRKDIKRKIIIAKNSGFCSGVRRAIELAEELAGKYNNVYTLDAILHNEEEVKRLKQKGIIPIENLKTKGDVLILPAHGATEEEIKTAETNFKKVVDTTCPLVLRTVHIIERLKKENYGIVIVGDKGHREVSVLSNTAGKNLIGIFRNKNEIPEKSFGKIGIVSQSTAFEEMLFSVTEKFLRYAKEVRFFNTVCDETLRRQKEAKSIAQTVDCVLVIGGKTSANTNRLFELVKKINKNSSFIQNEKDVKSLDLSQCKTLGIVSGTSTPKWLIDKIIEEINKQ